MAIGATINFLLSPLGLCISRTNSPDRAPTIELDPRTGTDDYDWKLYHLDYSAQIAAIAKTHTQKLNHDDFSFSDGKLQLRPGLLPLHPNHTVLYETIGALGAKSTLEVGCGGGDHLHNLSMLFPSMNVRGVDRSDGQLSFLRARSPHLAGKIEVMDATLPPSNRMPSADVVYSQAVIMHIQAGNGHRVALSNMFRMAERAVVLMENFKRHSFVDDITNMKEEGRIEWPEVHFYVRNFEGRPHILIASKVTLDGFEPLGSYQRLIDAMTWSPT
jgi:SAM-dependent methyltransferase